MPRYLFVSVGALLAYGLVYAAETRNLLGLAATMFLLIAWLYIRSLQDLLQTMEETNEVLEQLLGMEGGANER